MPKAKKPAKKPSKDALKIQELTEDLQRIQADFVNFKRRAEEDKLRATASGKFYVINLILPFVDNIQRALGNIPDDLNDHDYIKGVKSVAKQLDDMFEKLGIEKIVTVGKEFDPELMEAISMEDEGGDKEIVSEELQAGYVMEGLVIRHAMVRVKK